MKHLFYLIGIAFLMHELIWVMSPMKQVEKSKRRKGFKWGDWSNFSEEQKSDAIGILFNLLIFVWLFMGLFTFNWVAFATILAFNFLIIAPISKLLKFNLGYVVVHWFNSVIGIAFGVFVIVNSYHLKIDLFELAKNLINTF